MNDLNEKLKYLSSYTSKLLRNKFGRGPESCYAVAKDKFLLFYIKGFTSPIEEILLNQGQSANVDHARNVIMQVVMEELKGIIQSTLEIEVVNSYHDWNFPNNTGIIIVENNTPIGFSEQLVNLKMKKEIEAEVAKVSEKVQKVPNIINTYEISSKIFIVERIGILIEIEKALIQRGYSEELKITKDELEKSYFHHNTVLRAAFNGEIEDIFIDWDFKHDKSIMCFIISN